MAITDGLITAAEYGNYVEKPSPTGARLVSWEDAIEVASRWVEKHTGRCFIQGTGPRYFDPSGMFVYTDDVRAISEVAVDTGGDGNYATVTTNYQALPQGQRDALLGAVPYTSIKALRWQSWPTWILREGIIRVTGTWGWTAVPDDVKRATCIITQDLLRDPESNFGGLTVAADGIVLGSRTPPRAIGLLARYVRLERTVSMA